MKNITLVIIIIGIISASITIPVLVLGQLIPNPPTIISQNITTTTISGGRQSYSFCPTFPTIITANGGNYTVESCPQQRLYITNWNNLTLIQQQNINNSLNTIGWKQDIQ